MIALSILLFATAAAAPPAEPLGVPTSAQGVPAIRMLGELALSHGTLGFAACDGEAGVAYGAGIAGDLAAVVGAFNDGADGVVFLDADIAREGDGRWRIDRVHRAYHDGPRCAEDLRDFVWRGIASDGSWTLEVSRRYVSVRPVGKRPQFFRYRPFARGEDGHLRFSAKAEGETLGLVLRGVRCTDDTARRTTPWQIEINLGGIASPGCAWTGMPR
jgi:uncharacterized membrane protein